MQVKECFKCSITLPLDRFYRHPRMSDGRMNKCKECTKEDVRRNRRKKIEYYREYDRNRGTRSAPRIDPIKRKAHSAVSNAVRDGRMIKPAICSRCGSGGCLHAHHDDYDKPMDVVWLCVPCHKQRHKELGWGYVWNAGMDTAA